ncbi:hypothetical protein AA313_de0205766 [Arthrobotrys entomopaga]|nr:hypothetical protein AA313_de0205766 [Arthrobotrys entomopaga]
MRFNLLLLIWASCFGLIISVPVDQIHGLGGVFGWLKGLGGGGKRPGFGGNPNPGNNPGSGGKGGLLGGLLGNLFGHLGKGKGKGNGNGNGNGNGGNSTTNCKKLTNNLPAFQVAAGYQAKIVATGLTAPRQLIYTPPQVANASNRLLVLDKGVGVKSFVIDDCGLLTQGTTVVADPDLTHGLAISLDGLYIFASTSDVVYAYNFDYTNAKASGKTTLITGMASADHITRSLYIPGSNPDLLVVSVGSNANLDYGTEDINSGRSQIRGFKWRDLLNSPVVYHTAGFSFGWGLRNSVGLSEDEAGQFWSVENSADELKV